MPSKTLEITGTFEWETAHFANGDGPGTVIGKLRDGTTIKGPVEKGELELDLDYRFLGHWTNHHKYGRQFVFSTYVLAEPYGEIGTVKYLARAKGIGRARAQAMWNLWGSDAVGICKHAPERMCQEIKGVTADTARNAAEFFRRIEALEACTIALTELLDGRGFPKALVRQAIGRWGNRAVEEIKANPYGLMAFHGVGFARADTLYLDLGHPPEAMIRQTLCIHHAIVSDGDGHTWYEGGFCQRELNRKIGGAKVDLSAALWEGVFKQDKLLRRGVEGRTWVADRSRAKNEELVALRLRMAAAEWRETVWPAIQEPGEGPLTDHQQSHLLRATGAPIGVLAGSPGTGKTFSLAQLIKSIDPGHPVAVCAPTGKAAVRATESLAAQGVRTQATTIHRLLGVKEASAGGWEFEHGPGNPLPHKYIFVDESSMIDTDLMASLLSARRTGCQMLFVGDPNQLAPVGHGAPLRDMIAGGLPAGQLTEIHRNAGRIVRACAEIRDKHTFTPSKSLDLQAGENLVCIEKTSPQAQIAELQQRLESLAPDWDPIKDTYVLVAVNKKSPLGRHTLNKQLQAQLNPGGKQAAGNPFRVDDKVICLKNGWCESTIADHPEANEDGNVYVANGEIGYVIDVQPRATTVALTEPDREVRIPRGQSNGEDDTGCNWDLAYAITTHKSQGSEAPIVFVMIDEHPGARRLMTRNWIYTGISRAKVACVLIGRLATARAVCKRDGLRRKTFLAEMIRGEMV